MIVLFLLTLFSRKFMSDSKRYTALEQEIDLLRRAPLASTPGDLFA